MYQHLFVLLGLTNLLLTTAVRHIWLYRLWSRGFWDLEELHSPKLERRFRLSHSTNMKCRSDKIKFSSSITNTDFLFDLARTGKTRKKIAVLFIIVAYYIVVL